MNQNIGEKRCRVCQDKALGFNFSGLSCESCKAFFRRSALASKAFVCKKNNNCEITKANRKKCKACRLKKCFEIGMRKDLIWCFRDNSQPHSKKNVEIDNVNESLTKESHFTDLNLYELKRLKEIQEAMLIFPDESKLELIGKSATLLDTFNLPGNYVNKYIKYCKSIEAFRSLSSGDQLILLKHFYCEISAVRFSYNYDIEKDGFLCLANETEDTVKFINLKIFSASGRPDLEALYRRFAISMKMVMNNDPTLRDLVIVYFLFNKRTDISCPEYISYNQTLYLHLIRRHLETKYKDLIKADRKLNSLMEVLSEMDYICKTVEDVYLSFDASELAEIIAEIYNMT